MLQRWAAGPGEADYLVLFQTYFRKVMWSRLPWLTEGQPLSRDQQIKSLPVSRLKVLLKVIRGIRGPRSGIYHFLLWSKLHLGRKWTWKKWKEEIITSIE